MTDRDLIAEGRAKIAALTQSPSTDRAFDLAEWAGLNLSALLDALETGRARVAELEGEVDRWCDRAAMTGQRLGRRIAELEAAQRPPLGYVVGFEGVDGPELWATRREIHHDEDVARVVLADMRQEEPCMDFQLYEVREVQP